MSTLNGGGKWGRRIGLIGVLVAFGCALPASVVAQTRSVTVTVSGDTFDFDDNWSITNNSSSGQNITSCTVNLATATFPGGLVFATSDPSDDTDFDSPDTATVGLTSPEADGLEDSDVADRSSSFTMTFSDFDPGETFLFGIDVDDTADDAGINGADLNGTSISCTVGGTVISGKLKPTSSENSSATLPAQLVRAPALSNWGTLLLVLFMGIAGYLTLRRRVGSA